MPQNSLLDDHPTTTLVLEVEDQTLLTLSDATVVSVSHIDTKGNRRFVASTTFVGVGQDLLECALSRVLIAHRYGTDADVRMALVRTQKEAREHIAALERQ